jgi:hypothetical protein
MTKVTQLCVHKVTHPNQELAKLEANRHVLKYFTKALSAKATTVKDDGAYWLVTVEYSDGRPK